MLLGKFPHLALFAAAFGVLAACSDSETPQSPVGVSAESGVDGAAGGDGGLPDGTSNPDGGDGGSSADVNLADSTDGTPPPDVPPPPPTEMLLFDGDNRQFTESENGFHPLIEPGDPLPASDWSTPVDFYEGEFQIRYVVNGPANQQPGVLQTCIWTMGDADGDGRNYFPESCSSQVDHSGVGEYFNTRLVPSSWWKMEDVSLDFAHPERFLIRVVLRGASGCNVTTYNVSGACWNEWPTYQDMDFRVTIVMVSPGNTFSGWSNYP